MYLTRPHQVPPLSQQQKLANMPAYLSAIRSPCKWSKPRSPKPDKPAWTTPSAPNACKSRIDMIDEENIRNQVRNGVKILRIFQEEMGNIGNETEKLRNEKAILVKTL